MNTELSLDSKAKTQLIDNINKRIGLRIMKLRNRMQPKMTQQDLGDKVGVSHAQIARYERGDNYPSGARLVLIAEALNTTVSHFLGIEEFIEESNRHLSVADKETMSNLMEYFMDIGLPEIKEVILDHVQKMSRISFVSSNNQKTQAECENS